MENKLARKDWKRNNKKKGKLQKQRIKEHNCALGATGNPNSYVTRKPQTRRESLGGEK